MPQASAPGRAEPGGSMPTTMRMSGGARATRAASIEAARPQRVGALLDDLAVDLLAPQPRAGIARQDHLVEEGGRQMRGVGLRAAARVTAVRGSATSRLISAIGRGVVVTSWRGRAPSRRPNCSMSKVASGYAPLGELVAPGGVELRPAQLLGIFRREREAPPRRSAIPAAGATAVHCGRSARGDERSRPDGPLDHHLAHVALGLAHQRDMAAQRCAGVRRQAERQRAHPFGAQPGLAGAAPAQHQPGGPRPAVVGDAAAAPGGDARAR